MPTKKTTAGVRRREPTHPGAVLREDLLEPAGLAVTEAAARLGVTRKTLSALLNEHAGLSPQMAVRIGMATNTTPESWLAMQAAYDLWQARRTAIKVEPFEGSKAS